MARRSPLDLLAQFFRLGGTNEGFAVIPGESAHKSAVSFTAIAGSLGVVAFATVANYLLFGRDQIADSVMLYLLGIVVVSLRFGLVPSLTAALVSVFAFDFIFVPPYFSFAVTDVRHVTTLCVMLAVAATISGLAERLRTQTMVVRRAQLEAAAEKLRNSLLSSVSHDLRTPLAIVKGAASTIADEATLSTEDRNGLARTIVGEADRLNRLIGNLLDMTRLEAGSLSAKKEWQSIEEIIGSALARIDDRARDRKISAVLAPDLPLVPADAVLVEQVIVNLLENALRYTPPASPIEIHARQTGASLEIEVSDRGPGIASGDESKLFEKFYRAGSVEGGIGLGLTICKGIVTAHGGTIAARSREGGGATFSFTLPLAATPSLAAHSAVVGND